MSQYQTDVATATRIRAAVDAATMATVEDEADYGFRVTGENGTTIVVGVRDGATYVARVMGTARVTASAEFNKGWPLDMVIAAVVALVKEA